jgi:hypothetical protein
LFTGRVACQGTRPVAFSVHPEGGFNRGIDLGAPLAGYLDL